MTHTYSRMSRLRRPFRRRTKPGEAPGTLRVDPQAPPSVITVFAFGPESYVERRLDDVAQIKEFLEDWPVTWINIDGLGDEDVLNGISSLFDVHRLALEDVVNVHQRAKVEPYETHLYIVARMARLHDGFVDQEQMSLFVGEDFVLSFQEREGDSFDPVRERIRSGHGRVRKSGADYLAYALLDGVIDAFFPCVEHLGDRIEDIEAQVVENPTTELLSDIHAIKRELIGLRRAIWPAREAINVLLRVDTKFITEETRLYLRDCYDHVIQIIDMVETFREVATGQMDLYLSTIGQRTNEVVKFLTVFTAVFIPLSFIAGLYGMNFVSDDQHPLNMPELRWAFGYPAVLGFMAAVVVSMLGIFWLKGWLWAPRKQQSQNRLTDVNTD